MAGPFQIVRFRARVLANRRLSATGFELVLERGGLDFRAGQLVTVHDPVAGERSYTICSGEGDDELRLLVRRIPSGRLTPRLAALAAGDEVDLSGPYGEFTVRDPARPLLFVATGTGLAPARAYLRTHAGLRMTVVHGVRRYEDLFYRGDFAGSFYHPCVSGEDGPGFRGRVTEFCRTLEIPADAHVYLCGAHEMFYDLRDFLAAREFPPASVFTEAYYYRQDA